MRESRLLRLLSSVVYDSKLSEGLPPGFERESYREVLRLRAERDARLAAYVEAEARLTEALVKHDKLAEED